MDFDDALDDLLQEDILKEVKENEEKRKKQQQLKKQKKIDKDINSLLKKSYAKMAKQANELKSQYAKYTVDEIDMLIGKMPNSELMPLFSTKKRRKATMYHKTDSTMSSFAKKNNNIRLFNNFRRYYFSDATSNVEKMNENFTRPISHASRNIMRQMMCDYKSYGSETFAEFWKRFRDRVEMNESEIQWSFQKQFAMDNVSHNARIVIPEKAVDHFYWEKNSSRKKYFHLANIHRLALDGAGIYTNDNIVSESINSIYVDTQLKLAASKLPEYAYVNHDPHVQTTLDILRDKSFYTIFKDDYEYRHSLYKILYNLIKGGKETEEINKMISESRSMIDDEEDGVNGAEFLDDCDLRNKYPLPKKHMCYFTQGNGSCICGGKGSLLEDMFGLPVKNNIWFRQYPSHFHLKNQRSTMKKRVSEVSFTAWAANKQRKRHVDHFLHGELGARKKKKIKKKDRGMRRITDNFENNY